MTTSANKEAACVDVFNENRTGWARFSADRRYRYRLGRVLTSTAFLARAADVDQRLLPALKQLRRVVFVMLNPSTADAFRLDPTVNRCVRFATRWGADVLEVVNLFALRSPNPADLYSASAGERGADTRNNEEILAACRHSARVIVAWGNHGELDNRGRDVASRLIVAGVALHHLGLTNDGFPKHPLARGKAWIPDDFEPQPFVLERAA